MKTVILLAIVAATALAGPVERITNGRDAKVGEFPYQISLQLSMFSILPYQHICGGSLISDEWVVTAGHCITEIPVPGKMKVIAGISNLNDKNGVEAEVVEKIVHPDYQGGVNPNDIALLRLKTKIPEGDNIKYISLPNSGDLPTGDSTLSGWGSTSTGMLPNMPNQLQTVDLPLMDYEGCAAALTALVGSSEPLAESNVCTAPGGGKSACSGDSGGPLAQGNVLIGVVSWGMIPCGSDGAPSVYTRVSAHSDFIAQHVN